jgi:NAD(P)-dependent dehydrogenase (short-subunit alcohol dehydrogenase family)
MSVNQRHAFITGSSRGIGRGIALKLAESKVRIAVHYYQNEAAAKETLAQIREHGSDGFIVRGDILRQDDILRMCEKVKDEFGSLDIFVSNARPIRRRRHF